MSDVAVIPWLLVKIVASEDSTKNCFLRFVVGFGRKKN